MIAGVIASLIGGVLSIRIAADFALAALPPPAPPISLAALEAQLNEEQARGESLQQQLDDMLGVTDQLTAALTATEEQLTDDGSNAAQLRDRLQASKDRLALLTRLLKKAAAQLAALGQVAPTIPPAKPATGGGGGGGSAAGPTPVPTAAPTPAPAAFSLSLGLAGGDVEATWTTCTVNNFNSYALVRSTNSEIHYPPEDHDTVIATSTSNATTSATYAAPSGKAWYRVYCLTRKDGETKTGATTNTASITAP